MQQIVERNFWIKAHDCAFVSEEGRRFTYLLLSGSDHVDPKDATKRPKLRVWIQSGVHGNEPAGDQAVLALLGKFDLDQALAMSVLDKMDILIFPRYNPDGLADFNRPCSFGVDLNRDHIRLAVSQTASIRQIFCQFAPHIALDMHEYSAKATYGKYTHGSDVMFSAAKNLNTHQAIREMSEKLFATNIGRRLEEGHFRWEPYVPTDGTSISFQEASSDGKIGRNAMALTQCVSFLCEIRGLGIADQHFQRRTTAALVFVEAVLQIAIENQELIRTTLGYAINDFIHSSQDIVVQDKRTMIDRTFTMIDTENGKLVQQPVQLASTTPTTPSLIRTRPEAYVFPAFMFEVARHLRQLGLEVEVLKHELRGHADVFTITSASLEGTYYEGVAPVHVTVASSCKDVCMPVGAFLISTRQKNAALAFIALEPENVDSFVSCNIIPVLAGDVYPIYRLRTLQSM